MPESITLNSCTHCGRPHATGNERREHEADCAWGNAALADPAVRACPSCASLARELGAFCQFKGGAPITAPVTLCFLWRQGRAPVAAEGPRQGRGAA